MLEIQQLKMISQIPQATLCKALNIARASYYRHHQITKASSGNKISEPNNKLSKMEQQQVLDILHSERFVDSTVYQAYYALLDEEKYYCSIRTMYRLLSEQNETQDRRNQRSHRDAIKPELMACRPNEVWSWDITKLLSTKRLVYYYLYVIIDIYSRYVVGWMIAEKECQHLAHKLIQTTALRQGIQPGELTLHADNGPSMTSGTVAQLLEHLGIIKTHNRPYTSNDNPFSESQFKTLKYCPIFPERFNDIEHAEEFCQEYFHWYNTQHYHSGIAYLTPESVHYGQAESVLDKRFTTLTNAYQKNPGRFNHRRPVKKKLKPVYINPPQTVEIQHRQQEENMV